MNKYYRLVILLTILLMVFTACGKDSDRKLIGSYYKNIDETDYVSYRAKEYFNATWLSDELNMDSYFQNLSVSVNVLLYSDDTYEEILDEESYELMRVTAYEGLEKALCDLIILRMNAAGMPEKNHEDINDIMVDKLGMTAADYIAKYGPALVPEIEELKANVSVAGSFALPEEEK